MKLYIPISPNGNDEVCAACHRRTLLVGAICLCQISANEAISYSLCPKCSRRINRKKGLPPKALKKVDEFVENAARKLGLLTTH